MTKLAQHETVDGWGAPRSGTPHADCGEYTSDEEWTIKAFRPWMRDIYRFQFVDGALVYVAEPPFLSTQDLADLERLRRDGWAVRVDGNPLVSARDQSMLRVLLTRSFPDFSKAWDNQP